MQLFFLHPPRSASVGSLTVFITRTFSLVLIFTYCLAHLSDSVMVYVLITARSNLTTNSGILFLSKVA